ncbi:Fatty acid desaturase [Arboricoccus pini]|uniref:Fatty acid desaturase n=1 Tax=Arboricoccus pini TaxID=1963835 RepID=A0A212RMU5_9PROT|nr:fatty acid desaturase [Arboricoccus pini]SNB73888.1 Fatty acid desaturase [Arboricoccus pini]
MSSILADVHTITEQKSQAGYQLDPRTAMANRLPGTIQPFLTWLTARPAPGEAAPALPATHYVHEAIGLMVAGIGLGAAAFIADDTLIFSLMLFISLTLTTSGLGLFQVVIFHHCGHGAVFKEKKHNRDVGRLISALFLFKHFDAYRQEHMMHHNARKLLTEDDEFADFVLGMCRLEPSLSKGELWRRVLLNVVFSPSFHVRFLYRRLKAATTSPDRTHNLVSIGFWAGSFALAAASGLLLPFLLVWVLPVTLLLQLATIGRILCEHRFPEPALIAARGREFICLATAGVFPGAQPPEMAATTAAGLLAWSGWWANMLTVQLFVRLTVLVGDAPCHDFHHRRPAGEWTSYIHSRQNDVDAGCPGFPINYGENWGLFSAIDENLGTLAATPRDALPDWQH